MAYAVLKNGRLNYEVGRRRHNVARGRRPSDECEVVMRSMQSLRDRPETPAGPGVDRAGGDYDVVVIGAGPYGLSAGAYLKAAGSERLCLRRADVVLGRPDAGGNVAAFTAGSVEYRRPGRRADAECLRGSLRHGPAAPLPLETFVKYGRWFQRQLGFALDTRLISSVKRERSAFRLTLDDGAVLKSQRVVVAAGIERFQRKPAVFRELPSHLATHCYEGRKIADLAAKRVAVIGAGQSALESAALLSEAGAKVEIIATIPELRWIGMHKWIHELGPVSKALYSKFDVGPARNQPVGCLTKPGLPYSTEAQGPDPRSSGQARGLQVASAQARWRDSFDGPCGTGGQGRRQRK